MGLANDRNAVLACFLRFPAHRIRIRRNEDGARAGHAADVEAGGCGAVGPYVARDVEGPGERNALARAQGEGGGGGPEGGLVEKRAHELRIDVERLGDVEQRDTLLVGDDAVGPGFDGELAGELFVDCIDVVGAEARGDGGGFEQAHFTAGNGAVDKCAGQLGAIVGFGLGGGRRQGARKLPSPGPLAAARETRGLGGSGGERRHRILLDVHAVADAQVTEELRGCLGVRERRVHRPVTNLRDVQRLAQLCDTQILLRQPHRVQPLTQAVLRTGARELVGKEPVLKRSIVRHQSAAIEQRAQMPSDVAK